jgi:hypothetical protein
MKVILAALALVLMLNGSTPAQWFGDEPSGPIDQSLIPTVKLNDRAGTFQASLYPDYYKTHSALRDMRWVHANDSDLVGFWHEKGDSLLLVLSELSGLEWIEQEFDMYLVRHYPTVGGADPLVIPLGGMRRGILSEAAPTGAKQHLNLIYQLAHRMLAQAERSDDPFHRSMADHPLMQPGPYRRDNLAMLLTLVVGQQIIGLDSTYDAYQSAFWKQRTPGREVFERYLLSEWILSRERPLARWVVEEPLGSRLVALTRPPTRRRQTTAVGAREYIEGLPIKGRLGFSVKTNSSGRLVVDKIDINRLAFACGLREEDVIRHLDGRSIRTHKALIEKILAGLQEGGATLSITRDGQSTTVLIQPLDLDRDEDLYMWDDFEDSLYLMPPPTKDSTGEVPPPD